MESEYVEIQAPGSDGVCSDPDCPCDEVQIPRGTGFLYLSHQFVESWRQHRTLEEASDSYERQLRNLLGQDVNIIVERTTPILVCELGARLRRLDTQIASEDARLWWEMNRVPLRPTPQAHPIPKWILIKSSDDRQPVYLPLKGEGGDPTPGIIFAHNGEIAWEFIRKTPTLFDAYPHPLKSALFADLCRQASGFGDKIFHIVLGYGKSDTLYHTIYNIEPFLEHHNL